MDGTEQDMTRLARRFANRLRGRFHLPVHLYDERLSSREARNRMLETPARRGRKARHLHDDHAIAAQIILEGWLAHHASNVIEATAGSASGERSPPC